MEHITRQQVILIALLVAIITAISTSVATVSLLDNSPGGSQATIYKVIEKSIETVTSIPSVKEVVTPVKQVPVVTEISPSDIAANGAKSIVRIYEKVGSDKKFAALGVAVGSKDGVFTSALITPRIESSQYIAVTPDHREIPITWVRGELIGGSAFFTLNYDQSEKNKVPTLEIKDNSSVKLGGSVVALGGKESGNVVSTGIITEFAPLEGKAATSTDIMTSDMTLSSALSGWLLFDTGGSLVGFEMWTDADKSARFINGSIVKATLKDFL